MSAPVLDASALRELQRPLKEQYRQDAASAQIPATATASLGGEGIVAEVTSWAGPVQAGLHPAAGGDGTLACSADILLQALVGCAGVTLRSVATALGVTLHGGTVTARGTWDARGTLGVDREAPVGLTDIELVFDLDTDADEATTAKLLQLTERYCVVARTLVDPPALSVRLA
ncbi:OsmC family protein [Microbacterium sp.]|uniref:OsmC family protein n=1 Tax=Microbacterium sp. TaxID=51671 RepID=UPI003A8C2EBB